MKKFGKFMLTAALMLSLSVFSVGLASCGSSDDTGTETSTETSTETTTETSTETSSGSEGLTVVEPTNDSSYWDAYDSDAYIAEDYESKDIAYDVYGYKDHYGSTQYFVDVHLFTDGFARQTIYCYYGSSTGYLMVHYGYWEADDDEISVYMFYYTLYGTVYDLTASTTFVVDEDENVLVGQAVYSLFTYGQDYADVSGDDTVVYETDDDFKVYADATWLELFGSDEE